MAILSAIEIPKYFYIIMIKSLYEIIILIIILLFIAFMLYKSSENLKKENIKNSLILSKDLYNKYKEERYLIFKPTQPLMTHYSNEQFLKIDKNTFAIKNQNYDLNKDIKLNYKIIRGKYHNYIKIYINEKQYTFEEYVIPISHVLAFLIIIYAIKNNLKEITSELFI